MSVTASTFRVNFPEFANVETYPDVALAYWLGIAAIRLNADRWGVLLDHGTELFVAHQIALSALDAKAAMAGGTPGLTGAVLASKSVDRVSVTYDTASTLTEGAGDWNATRYGRQFWELAGLTGAGGVQL